MRERVGFRTWPLPAQQIHPFFLPPSRRSTKLRGRFLQRETIRVDRTGGKPKDFFTKQTQFILNFVRFFWVCLKFNHESPPRFTLKPRSEPDRVDVRGSRNLGSAAPVSLRPQETFAKQPNSACGTACHPERREQRERSDELARRPEDRRDEGSPSRKRSRYRFPRSRSATFPSVAILKPRPEYRPPRP